MKVCVLGLWHLGTVTASCLTSGGHRVTGLDFNESVIADLRNGKPPLFEPGLEDLVKKGIQSGALDFSTDPAQALRDAQVIWVATTHPWMMMTTRMWIMWLSVFPFCFRISKMGRKC